MAKKINNDNPCEAGKYHDYARSGIFIENGVVKKKCANCGKKVEIKIR